MLKIKTSFTEQDKEQYEAFLSEIKILKDAKMKGPIFDPKTGIYRVYFSINIP